MATQASLPASIVLSASRAFLAADVAQSWAGRPLMAIQRRAPRQRPRDVGRRQPAVHDAALGRVGHDDRRRRRIHERLAFGQCVIFLVFALEAVELGHEGHELG